MQTSGQLLILLCAAAAGLCLCSCATKSPPRSASAHSLFTQRPDYPETSLYWRNIQLYDQVSPANTHIKIDTALQRGFLMHDNEVVIDYPICSGRKSHPTPKGLFNILEKKEKKSSNRYGRIYDAEGKMINSDADIRTDEVPDGGKFVGAPMPYWMRLTYDGIGHHIGPTLRRPVSHGCIRGPTKVIPLVYAKVEKGTKVIVDEPSARLKKYASMKTQSMVAVDEPASSAATQ